MVVSLETKVLIEAEPSVVYGVLHDLEKYEEWNPLITKAKGKFVVNSRLNLSFSNGMTFKPKVLVVEKDKEIRWLGKLPVPCMFNGEHYFILERQDSGHTLLVQGEHFTGLLPPFLPKLVRETEEKFEALNAELKARCEAMTV